MEYRSFFHIPSPELFYYYSAAIFPIKLSLIRSFP